MATEGLAVDRRSWAAPGWLQPALVLSLAAAAILLLALGLASTRSALHVDLDGQELRLRTHAMTVQEALDEAGLVLYPEDWVSPGLKSAIEPGMRVEVVRALPVTLHADGETRALRTHVSSVGELLAEAGTTVGPGDEAWLNGVLVSLDTPLGRSPSIAIHRAITVVLDFGSRQQTVHTTKETVGALLESRRVAVYEADLVTPGTEERLRDGMTIAIERSVPLKVEVDGHLIPTRTRAKTVAALLGEVGVALVGQDIVEPGLSAPIRAAMSVRVTRVHKAVQVEFEEIPFVTVWVQDPDLEIDHSRLAQEGVPGMTKRRYRVRYENGQEVERVLEDSWAELEPVTKTMAYGTKIVVRTLDLPDGTTVEYWRKMRVYTTSYTAASCGKPRTHPRYGYTRLGWWLTKGVVAVDPEVIPLKTKLYVPGYGLARAGDTGGGVKGKFVDLGFDEWNYQSWHWWTDVYILTPVPPRSDIRWVLPNWPQYPDKRR